VTRGFFVSAALHVSLLLLFVLAPRPPSFDWDRADAIAVELVPLAVPAAEPPAEIPEMAPVVQSEPEPPVEAPPDPEPVQQRAKPKPFRIIRPVAPRRAPEEGPSLMERIEERLAKAATPAEPTKPAAEASAPAATSTASAEVHATDFPYLWYLNLVRTKITDVWDPPGDRMVKGRTNRVLLRFVIHRDGRVTDVSVEGGSGTPGLDASAQRAVEQARPFPPLPDVYEGELLEVAVRFTVEGGT
jgi:TonB family protein